MKHHWYLVTHRAGSRLFVQEGIKEELSMIQHFKHPEGKLRDSDLVSDRPGRTDRSGFAGLTTYGTEDAARNHVLESFAHQLGTFLETEAQKNSFASIVLVAAPDILGELNKFIGKGTASRQRPALIKDLAHVSDREMAQHLTSVLVVREEIAAQN